MGKFKVLVPQSIAEEGISFLQRNDCEVVIPNSLNDETMKKAVADCDAILIRTAELGCELIESANNLKVIARHGVGLNNVDIETATKKGIYVCNAPTSNINAVAEHVVGLIIGMSHHIISADKAVRRGDFEARNRFIGDEVSSKKLGLIGFGNIGKLVAEKCRLGLGMHVLAYDPYVGHDQMERLNVKKVENIDELMMTADYISLHIPYSPTFHHVINQERLRKMKPTAYLINAARGGLVDEQALYELLISKQIKGAALDCFEEEPPPIDHPFWQLDNVVVTPHMAAHTKESMVRMAMDAAKEIVRVKNGREPIVCVNKLDLEQLSKLEPHLKGGE